MARYRKYKNGIYGHRYKGFYIVKDEADGKKSFSILGADKSVLDENIRDYYDAEWEIDKITASPEMLKVMQELYREEIFMLGRYFVDMMQKDNGEGLTQDEKAFYELVKKIRSRKANDKPY